jgi:hypothetical protein
MQAPDCVPVFFALNNNMKKFLLIFFAVFGFAITGQAQTTTSKKAVPAASVTPAKKPAAGATAPVKKDGSPDMRFRKNKEAAAEKPKLKKDGTPDMRYKRNKKD